MNKNILRHENITIPWVIERQEVLRVVKKDLVLAFVAKLVPEARASWCQILCTSNSFTPEFLSLTQIHQHKF